MTFARRRLLSQTAAAAAASMVRPARAAARAAAVSTDVLVIGAGLSGLNAALTLQRAGLRPLVIEARPRAGGRLMTFFDLPGQPEAGGMGQRPHYARCLDTAAELGLQMENTIATRPFREDYLLALGGEIIPAEAWPGHPRNRQPEAYRALLPWAFMNKFTRDMNPLFEASDWTEPRHAGRDVSMYDFMRAAGIDDAAIDIAFLNSSHGYSAHHLSALQAFQLDAWGKAAQRDKVAPASYRVAGGNQRLPLAMAEALQEDVHYNKDVIGIRHDDAACHVHCADGSVYTARHVICSIPFSVLRRIPIDPPLAGLQGEALNLLGYDLITKVSLIPAKPFWEDDGLSPNMHTDSRFGRLRAEAGDAGGEIGTITMTLYGPHAHRADQYGADYVNAMLIPEIERVRPAAKGTLKLAAMHAWGNDPFASGSESCFGPGQVVRYVERIGAPHGRLFFCGEHLSAIFRGSMEGAMESGETAALQLLNGVQP